MKTKYFIFLLAIITCQNLFPSESVFLSQKEPKLFQDSSLAGKSHSVPTGCKSKVIKEETGKLFLDCEGVQGWILKIHVSAVSSKEKPLTLTESDFKRQSINRSRVRLNDASGTLASRGFLYSDKDSSKIFQSQSEAESSLIWLDSITYP